MGQYLEKGKDLLKVLTKNGCEAYIIGEASRCEITEQEAAEVELVTSATPGMIRGIFDNFKVEEIDDVTCRINYEGFEYMISTFRSSPSKNEKRRQVKEVYSKNLEDELSNRLMTCDAIAMTSGGKFTDAYNGFKDIKKKNIRAIGNVKIRLKKYPKNSFKVLKVYAQTGYKLDVKLYNGIKEASKKFKELEVKEYIDDLRRILSAKYWKKAFHVLNLIKIHKKLPLIGLEIKRLEKAGKSESFEDFLIHSMILNGEVCLELVPYLENEEFSKQVVNLALACPKSKYDNLLLYNYGLEVALKANEALYRLGKSKKCSRKITKMYNKLPIKKPCDLEFKGDDLIALAKSNGPFVVEIMEDIIYKVVMGELTNDRDVLTSYASRMLQEKEVMPVVEEAPSYQNIEEVTEEKVPIYETADQSLSQDENQYLNQSQVVYSTNLNSPEVSPAQKVSTDYDNYKYQALQRELAEVRRMISEKDEKINSLQKATLINRLNNEVETLVNQQVALLDSKGVFTSETDKILYIKDQRNFHQTMLLKKPEYAILTKEDLENEKN